MADSDDSESLSEASSTLYQNNDGMEEVSSDDEDSVVEMRAASRKRPLDDLNDLNKLLDEQSRLAKKINNFMRKNTGGTKPKKPSTPANSLSAVYAGSTSTILPRPGIQIMPSTSAAAATSIDLELPSIPDSLILRCQDVEASVHLADLLPQNRGLDQSIYARHSSIDQQCEEITTISQWIRAFSVFAAYRTSSHPHYAVPLWSYVDIVTGMADRDEPWLKYDVNFRIHAALHARPKGLDLSIWCRVHDKSLQDAKPHSLPVALRLGSKFKAYPYPAGSCFKCGDKNWNSSHRCRSDSQLFRGDAASAAPGEICNNWNAGRCNNGKSCPRLHICPICAELGRKCSDHTKLNHPKAYYKEPDENNTRGPCNDKNSSSS